MARIGCIVSLLLCASTAYAQSPEEKAAEEKAKARIAEFKKSLGKCRAAEDYVAALDGLGSEPHPLILKELLIWLAKPAYEVRIKAAEEIGRFKDDGKAALALINATIVEKEAAVATACLAQVQAIGSRKSAKAIPPLFNHKDKTVAIKALEVIATIKTKDTIEILINQLFKGEGDKKKHSTQDGTGIQNGPSQGSSQYGQQAGAAEEAAKRIEEMLTATRQALINVTKQTYMSSMQYKEWWAKSKATWKEPEPKPEEEENE